MEPERAIDGQAGWVVFDADVSTRASEVMSPGGRPTARRQYDERRGAPSKSPDLALGAGGRAALSWQDDRDGNAEVYLLTGT